MGIIRLKNMIFAAFWHMQSSSKFDMDYLGITEFIRFNITPYLGLYKIAIENLKVCLKLFILLVFISV